MNPLTSRLSVRQMLAALGHKVDGAFDGAADAIKDSLLDWSMLDEPAPPVPEPLELPPFSQARFVGAMREKVEHTLAQVAEILNDAPSGQIIAASEERVGELLAELWCEALELGRKMRAEAVAAGSPPVRHSQGEWVQRFRLMRAGEPPFPYPKDPVTGERDWSGRRWLPRD